MDNGTIYWRCSKLRERNSFNRPMVTTIFPKFPFLLCLYLHNTLANYLDYHILDIPTWPGSKCFRPFGIRYSRNNPPRLHSWRVPLITRASTLLDNAVFSLRVFASFPGFPHFFFFCSQYDTQKQKSAPKKEGLGTLITWCRHRGRGGAWLQICAQ